MRAPNVRRREADEATRPPMGARATKLIEIDEYNDIHPQTLKLLRSAIDGLVLQHHSKWPARVLVTPHLV